MASLETEKIKNRKMESKTQVSREKTDTKT